MQRDECAPLENQGKRCSADEVCRRHGLRLTAIRRAILEMLIASDTPVKAYDIIDRMRSAGKRITPATTYRTLEFLLQQKLAHRVNALNAYIPCTMAHECASLLLVVCSGCQKAYEVNDAHLYEEIRKRLGNLGFSFENATMEIQGTCSRCGRPTESRDSVSLSGG